MVEIFNKTKNKINLKLVKTAAEKFLKAHKKEKHNLSIVFVGDKKIKELNKKYRKKNKITDILAFDGDGDFFGEIIINYAQIRRQAKLYNNSVQKELIFILIHGLLHLLGYGDETEKERKEMIRKGEGFIKKFIK